ncbi:hypothetical protein SRABI106_02737 [Rahnella aquatilis]|nr:hypothetical protein SRABI106_02737 [Rahnella aquatilis]
MMSENEKLITHINRYQAVRLLSVTPDKRQLNGPHLFRQPRFSLKPRCKEV